MQTEKTLPLFYEDIDDAISKTINGNPAGLSLKQIACDIWPSRSPDTARSLLSRAMNPENPDRALSPGEMVRIMEITGRPEDVIYYLCDKFGFDRPARKDKEKFEKYAKQRIDEIQKGLLSLLAEVKRMEG